MNRKASPACLPQPPGPCFAGLLHPPSHQSYSAIHTANDAKSHRGIHDVLYANSTVCGVIGDSFEFFKIRGAIIRRQQAFLTVCVKCIKGPCCSHTPISGQERLSNVRIYRTWQFMLLQKARVPQQAVKSRRSCNNGIPCHRFLSQQQPTEGRAPARRQRVLVAG